MGKFNWLEAISDFDSLEGKRETILKSPFSWAGGKTKSVQHILPNLPYRETYIEPFGGSGVVLLNRVKSKLEVFNDRHSGIIALYKCLRDERKTLQVQDYLSCLLHSREEFIDCRDHWNDCTDDVERAAKWYYSIMMSFSSLGRNFGRSVSGGNNLASRFKNRLSHLSVIHQRIKDVLIENQDAMDIIRDFDSSNSVFYLDPPYYGVYSGTYKHEYTEKDHINLLDTVMNMKGFVAVSSYDNDLYKSYDWDKVYDWEVLVSIKAMAFREENNKKDRVNARQNAKEMLFIKE